MTTPKDALTIVESLIRRDPACFNLSDELQSVRAALRSIVASLQGEDAVEMVARIIDPDGFCPEPNPDESKLVRAARRHLACEKARAILATGLVPDEAAIRADASYLDFFEKHPGMELSCSWEEDDGPWEVHRVTGGRNDREWTKIGQGKTPREAIAAAIRSNRREA